ncbi:hypothetical protein [Seonamhaeicola sp. ML3]|uniref:hypothetical protein n=1 Tax=Seonamhaeicola sp. ML3 TaxID=2937786 RepID=UPI00200FEC67|nr:hypothetical protein [Seonamhaeicola sp. ML3]
MGTALHAISNTLIPKVEIITKKDIYLEQLQSLNLEHTLIPTYYSNGVIKKYVRSDGDWEYQLPKKYNHITNIFEVDHDNKEIINFDSPFVFQIGVYENCLDISTIYRYSYLYNRSNPKSLIEFRKNIYDIISVFGGTEIIYLADNACDKLSEYLECKVWDGVSYSDIKNDMISKGLTFISNYEGLKLNNLNYRNIKEIVFDDFEDLQE